MEAAPVQRATVRKPAPSFKAQAYWNKKFQEISLEQFKGKYVVLFFYPLISLLCAQLKSFNSLTRKLNLMPLIAKLSHAQLTLTLPIKNGLRKIERREDSVKWPSQCSLILAIKSQKIMDASLKTVVMPVLLSEPPTSLMEMEF